MIQNYNTLVDTLTQFSTNHLTLKRFKASFFEQIDSFSTEDNMFPILYAIPNDVSFDTNIDEFSFRVYCVDILQKDRSNESSILNETLLVLRDLTNWIRLDIDLGLNLINTPSAIPVNNFLTEFTTGWYIDITIEAPTETSDCAIPFSDNFHYQGVVCESTYISQFLTCETLATCGTFINLEDRVTALEVEFSGATASPFGYNTGSTTSIQPVLGNSISIGDYSYAEGDDNVAEGDYSHAEGNSSTAEGESSHAEGNGTTAEGEASHAEGKDTVAEGDYSHAEGRASDASGESSHAEGYDTNSNGMASHAEGYDTDASGDYSHAEGEGTEAEGYASHAEGKYTLASGSTSHAEGLGNIASGTASHAEGGISDKGNFPNTASGLSSHAEGAQTTASGDVSHAEGFDTIASGRYSHTQGEGTRANSDWSHAEGIGTVADGEASHAEGNQTQANSDFSHAEGDSTVADGEASHAEGYNTNANGDYSHSEGYETVTEGEASHAEGNETVADGDYSHAGGDNSEAYGDTSFIHSTDSSVTGDRSVVLGGTGLIGDLDDTVYVPGLNVRDIGTASSIGNLGIDIDGNVVTGSAPDLSEYIPYIGSGLTGSNDRMVESDSNGDITATKDIYPGYIVDGNTRAKLSDISNWNIDAVYIGAAIVNTVQGQKWVDDNYFFEAIGDNKWIRLIRG